MDRLFALLLAGLGLIGLGFVINEVYLNFLSFDWALGWTVLIAIFWTNLIASIGERRDATD